MLAVAVVLSRAYYNLFVLHGPGSAPVGRHIAAICAIQGGALYIAMNEPHGCRLQRCAVLAVVKAAPHRAVAPVQMVVRGLAPVLLLVVLRALAA